MAIETAVELESPRKPDAAAVVRMPSTSSAQFRSAASRRLFGAMLQRIWALPVPAGGPGAAGTVDRRLQVTTLLLAFSLDGRDAFRFLFLPRSTHSSSNPANPGSDWMILDALAFDGRREGASRGAPLRCHSSASQWGAGNVQSRWVRGPIRSGRRWARSTATRRSSATRWQVTVVTAPFLCASPSAMVPTRWFSVPSGSLVSTNSGLPTLERLPRAGVTDGRVWSPFHGGTICGSDNHSPGG